MNNHFLIKHPGIIAILFLLTILLGSCCTKKVVNNDEHLFVIILLDDDLNNEFLLTNYKNSGIQSVKASSKSQNLYQCDFLLNKKKIEQLKDKLKADKSILQWEMLEVKDINTSNSTNEKYNKTGPIKK